MSLKRPEKIRIPGIPKTPRTLRTTRPEMGNGLAQSLPDTTEIGHAP